MGWWLHLSSSWSAINLPDSVKTMRSCNVASATSVFKQGWKQFMKVFFQTQLSRFRPGIVFFFLPNSSLAAGFLWNYSFSRQLLAQAESRRVVPCLNSYSSFFLWCFLGYADPTFCLAQQMQLFQKWSLCFLFDNAASAEDLQSVWSKKFPSLSTKFHEGTCAHQGCSSKRALQCHT